MFRYILTRYLLSSSVLSILIGIFAGIAVNLFTNTVNNNFFIVSIILLLVVVLCFVLLIYFYEKFIVNFHQEKTENSKKNEANIQAFINNTKNYTPHIIKYDKVLWLDAIKKEKLKYYYAALLLSIILSILSLIFVANGKIEISISERSEKDSISVLYNNFSNSILELKSKFEMQSDSLHTLIEQNKKLIELINQKKK